MILNMISTVAMIRLGYVRGNRMTNMKASNEKLQDRAVRILMEEAGIEETEAAALMEEAGGDLRVALVMSKAETDKKSAEHSLREMNDVVDKAIELSRSKR
jgi:N-acetylmuramic acid 6-phosphate etherase